MTRKEKETRPPVLVYNMVNSMIRTSFMVSVGKFGLVTMVTSRKVNSKTASLTVSAVKYSAKVIMLAMPLVGGRMGRSMDMRRESLIELATKAYSKTMY